jgi:long-chain acyl-CoA synthetase
VPLYGTLPPNQVAFILKNSGARAVVVSNADQLAKIREIESHLPELEFMVIFDAPATLPARVHSLRQLLESGKASRPDEKAFRQSALQAKPQDLATLIYTSGTTAEPKGVMLTHNNLFSNVAAQSWLVAAEGGDQTLSFLPLSHVFQRMVDYCVYYHGIPIAYVASLDDVATALQEVKPTIVCAVPRVYEKSYARIMSATGVKKLLVDWARNVALEWSEQVLAGHKPGFALELKHRLADALVYKKIRARMGGRLRFFVSGSAPLNPQIARFFYGAGVLILEGYGLTETSPVTNVNRPDAMRIGTVGKPVPGTEIMIADDGEILVRGPQVMKGYFDNPEATAEAIDSEGWFHTGDIGDLDPDDFLRITDRKKEIIVTAGGKKIVPQPIQNQAKASPYVADAVILGDKRPFPIMIVVPDFASLEAWAAEQGIRWTNRTGLVHDPRVYALIEGEVTRQLSGLARFEMPKKFLIMDREFEINRDEVSTTLKVKRRVVERNLADAIESLYQTSAEPAARS